MTPELSERQVEVLNNLRGCIVEPQSTCDYERLVEMGLAMQLGFPSTTGGKTFTLTPAGRAYLEAMTAEQRERSGM